MSWDEWAIEQMVGVMSLFFAERTERRWVHEGMDFVFVRQLFLYILHQVVVVIHSTGSKTAGLQLPPTPPKCRAVQSPKPPAGQPPPQGPTTGL